MAVVAVTEIWDGRKAARDMNNVREYTRTFLVQTDKLTDGPFTVGSPITGIPPLYSYYTDPTGAIDLGARVVKYSPEQMEDPLYWKVTVEYSSAIDRYLSPHALGNSGRSGKAEQASKGQQDPNPLNRPPVICLSTRRYQKPVFHNLPFDDSPPVPILNSAGQIFSPMPEIDDSRIFVTIDRNEPVVNFDLFQKYQDAVNADPFWGEPEGCAKININAGSAFENGQFYWKVTYEIEFRRPLPPAIGDQGTSPVDGWKLPLVDNGMMMLDKNVPPNLVVLHDPSSGRTATHPVNLNGFGHRLASCQGPKTVFSGTQIVFPIRAPGFDPMEGIDEGASLIIDEDTNVEEVVEVLGTGVDPSDGPYFSAEFGNVHTAPFTIKGAPFTFYWDVYKKLPFAPLLLPFPS